LLCLKTNIKAVDRLSVRKNEPTTGNGIGAGGRSESWL